MLKKLYHLYCALVISFSSLTFLIGATKSDVYEPVGVRSYFESDGKDGGKIDKAGTTVIYSSARTYKNVPPSISDFKNLRSLSLHGGGFSQLPESLYDLNVLEVLDFYYSNLTSVSKSLSRLKRLSSLQLEYNEMRELPNAVGDLRNLRVFNVKGVRLKELPESIQNLKKLNYVHISAAYEEKIREISPNLLSINDDAEFAWAHYILQENVARRAGNEFQFPEPKKYEHPVKEITLTKGNRLDLSLLNSSRLVEVENIDSVQEMFLSFNHLEELPSLFSKFGNVRKLDLSVNRLKGIKINEFRNPKKLVDMSIAMNQLVGLDDDFSKLENLQRIDLSLNNFSEFPSVLLTLNKLESIDLSGNGIRDIPTSLNALATLKELILTGNPIDDPSILAKSFPNIKIVF